MPLKAEIFVIAKVDLGYDQELRLVQNESGQFVPDLVVDHAAETTSKPPPCFETSKELDEVVQDAWIEFKDEIKGVA